MVGRTILIVEDTPDHRDMLCTLLQSVGYRVITAEPGSDAMEHAQRERPDLILAALSLPGQLAWETARRLRADPVLAATPILGTTVYNTLLSSARLRALGCAGFVEKPFDYDGLLHQISRHMPRLPHAPVAA